LIGTEAEEKVQKKGTTKAATMWTEESSPAQDKRKNYQDQRAGASQCRDELGGKKEA